MFKTPFSLNLSFKKSPNTNTDRNITEYLSLDSPRSDRDVDGRQNALHRTTSMMSIHKEDDQENVSNNNKPTSLFKTPSLNLLSLVSPRKTPNKESKEESDKLKRGSFISPRSSPITNQVKRLSAIFSDKFSKPKSPENSPRSPRKWTGEIQRGGSLLSSGIVFVDPTLYNIDFDALMKIPKTRTAFEGFLKSIRNEEQISFINRVEDFKSLHHAEMRYLEALSIYETFIVESCKQELNISNEEREYMNMKIGEISIMECPSDLFDKIFKSIYLNLQHDSFQRFVNTYSFQEMCQAMGDSIFCTFLCKK
jgi:hypothetical protein